MRAKLPGVRIHDLRHTNATWKTAMGVSLAIVGKSLGHRTLATTAKYAHAELDPIRAAVAQTSAAMLAAATGKEVKAKKPK